MDVEGSSMEPEACVDWRRRPCRPGKHGGMRAAAFVLGIQAFEIMAIAAVGNNLITYVFNEMHFPLSQSANIVTNFVGTVFLISLLGGFLSDSYLGSFWTMLIFGFVELSGFILLAVQAHLPQLKPPPCIMSSMSSNCEEASGYKATFFFIALYLIALGSGCMKPNMIAHGADQLTAGSGSDHRPRTKLSTYFNCAYFSFCAGELVALTVLVWVQTRSGMDVGFAASAAAMAAGMACLVSGTRFYMNKPPQGSIFLPIARVFAAAIAKRKQQVCPARPELTAAGLSVDDAEISEKPVVLSNNFLHADKFRFLDKASVRTGEEDEGSWTLCTPAQVQQVKTLLAVIPIFACTIVFNTILAQLQTFSVQQGSTMNTTLGGKFRVPPASLQSIPYLVLLVLVPAYELLAVPFMRRLTKTESGVAPLHRIGVGLFVATFSMISAAMVEKRRRDAAVEDGRLLTVMWLAPQFLIFGVSEMFTAVGLIEFFYRESESGGMQSFLTALTYCSYSFGFFLSSVLVAAVNKITARGSSSSGWLGNNNLNADRLDNFYWLLAALSALNFFNFLFWVRWHSGGRRRNNSAHNGR